MLDISLETEKRLREFAARKGLSVDALLTRLLDQAEIERALYQRSLKESNDEKRQSISVSQPASGKR